MTCRRSSFGRSLTSVLAGGAFVAATATLTPFAAAEPPVGTPGATAERGVKSVAEAPDGKYIVGLRAEPVATYGGSVAGLSATRSADGIDLERGTDAVAAYRSYLDTQRATVLAAVPGLTPFYEYDWAFAGFAATMTYEQALQVAVQPGVRMVEAAENRELETTHSPTFLGLDQPGGAWETAGGADVVGGAGEDIVIGVVDGGFTPESGSFAPLDPAPSTTVPDGWLGTCDPGDPDDLGGGPVDDETTDGDQPAELDCDGDVYNSKVIGARYFVEGYGPPDPDEFLSPRDLGGHGSHTGSTAGGNYGVPITVAGAALGDISGMAPRARIAAYKVCWQEAAGGLCNTADSAAAIDQATADGVGVINFSVGGSTDTALDAVALSFFGAASAGIFVAVSAGNAGTVGSVAHNYPWVTTNAASTEDRRFEVTATLGNGDTYSGTGISTGVAETDAVYAGDIPADDYPGDPSDAAFCPIGSLDPDGAAGKIVVCERGLGVARVDKSEAVAQAGGVGMVLTNDEANGASTNTERHSVPTVHVSFADGQEIIDYVTTVADPTIAISPYEVIIGDEVTAPSMASFSSRGPAPLAGGDVLKPDITAPGVDILASLAPYADNFYELYGFESGTSMSSPHIAGIGALLKDIHPDWSPMAIKSALMTGAYQTNNQGEPIDRLGEVATPFEMGAGHVDPQASVATPLVYDSTVTQWLQFLCGTEIPDDPVCEDVGGRIDPSDLNLASIAIGDLAGTQTVTRTLTNVSDATVVVTGAAEVADITAVLDPAELTIAAGASASYSVTFTSTATATVGAYSFGSLTWTEVGGDERVIRSPVAIQPVAIGGTDDLLVGEGSTGSVTDLVTSGTTGPIDVALGGLEPATVDAAVLTNPDTEFPDPPVERDDIYEVVFDVGRNAHVAQFALYDADYVAGTDLDMYVYLEKDDGDLDLVATSATGVAGESVRLDDPDKGTYHVFVHLWALAAGETEVEAINHSWAVTDDDVDDFSVDPVTLDPVIGEQDVTFSWTDLAGPNGSGDQESENLARYLGTADYVDGVDGAQLARTVVRVDVAEGLLPPTTPPPTTPPPTEPPTEPPTTAPTEPPTSPATPVPSTTLPNTGGGDTPMFAALGLGAILIGAAFVTMAARRLREDT